MATAVLLPSVQNQDFTSSSAAGVLSLLEEQDSELKALALQRLESLVDTFWAEISEQIKRIEALYLDESFEHRQLAALVASKVYYHLGRLDDSLEFALGAGSLLDVNKKGDAYVDTIIAKCIDSYKLQSQKKHEGSAEERESVTIDHRLQDIVERMFDRCFQDGEWKQALGIAMECRRLDKVEQSITRSGKLGKMISYCFDIALNLILNREFRQQVLRLIVKLYTSMESPDYFGVVQCLMFLGDFTTTSEILRKLLQGDEDSVLTAYQVAFDLQDRAPQAFLSEVRNLLPQAPTPKKTDVEDVDEEGESSSKGKATVEIPAERLEKIHSILTGQVTISLYVDFLFRHNHTDMTILKNIKGSFERNSILHSATVTANAYMHAGTTVDQFLRENLDWLGRASNWSKFSATASLGVIHKGQIKDSLNILKPYLPAAGATTQAPAQNQRGGAAGQGSVYSEGGALYALGIIHSNHGDNMTEYLANIVKKERTHAVVQHGACLGLGLAAMATGREDLYDSLKDILYTDNAISGETAAVAIGLVMLGTANARAIEELRAYAGDTSHEKIIRGLAMALALTMYGREEEADVLIDDLLADKDPVLRYGAMYTIGLAYCGTGNNSAIRKLLQNAVSDVSDDVRRAAVMNLGFVLFKTPKQCPRLVSLLAESYNPHVRYGVAMAIGISCAGTGLPEAIEILESLSNDGSDFVRQGALLALAMVLMQYNENSTQKPNQKNAVIGQKVKEARKKFETIWSGREEIMTKTGAILSSGIIDAGGRNVSILLHKNGQNKMRNIVGLAMFTQYWFWYPYLHFLSLSFEPTAVIGLNKELNMPKYKFKSNARPSLFAYPAPVKAPETEKKQVVTTAELSVAAKAKARDARRKRNKGDSSAMGSASATPFSASATPFSATTTPFSGAASSAEGEKKPEEEKKEEKKEEPTSELLENPARVTLPQLKVLSFDADDKYEPLKFKHHGLEMGIVLLKKLKAEEQEELVERKSNVSEDSLPEPEPPAAFEWP